MAQNQEAAQAYARFLKALGLNDTNANIDLEDSAAHTAELMAHWMGGLNEPRPALMTMNSPARELVSLHELPFYSFCGHHFVPFFGTIDIDYIPNEYIAGLGGFTRIIDYYARRPQFQEQLCAQIAEHIAQDLNPVGVRVCVKARQMCLELHGKGAGIQIEAVRIIGEMPSCK